MNDDFDPPPELVERLAGLDERLRQGLLSARSLRAEVAALEEDAELAGLVECVQLLESRWPRGAAAAETVEESGARVPLHPAVSLALGDGRVPPRFGKFLIKRELGRGGFGVVLLAEDTVLGRDVALKLPRPELLLDRGLRRRFLQEAQAAAAIDHPHVTPIHEAGQIGVVCYLAAAYCPGGTLAGWLAESPGRLPPRLAARLVESLALALQRIHEQGILHRDLKPGNVLLWPVDAPAAPDELPFVPKLTDFGLSKVVTDNVAESQTSVMMGTPLYMAPEQAEGRFTEVGPATDLYALGAILYELLTGRSPFAGSNLIEVFDKIRHDDPPRPGLLDRTVPADLEIICLRCLEKQPGDRYPSALALADDLSRYRRGLPIAARRPTLSLQIKKFSRRHPVWMVSVAASVLLASALLAGVSWHAFRLAQSLAVSDRLRAEGGEREQVLRQELYANDIQRAAFSATSGDIVEARRILARYLPAPGERDERGVEWAYLSKLAQGPRMVMAGHEAHVLTADVSPDRQLLASGDRGGTVKIWSFQTGTEIRSLRYSQQEVTSVHFSPDGTLLATAGQDRTIRVWDVRSWTETRKLEKHERTITGVAWSPDGQRLASSGRDHQVHIWDVVRGSVALTLPEHTDVVRCLAWSPDGKLLATADVHHGVQLWDTATWRLQGRLLYRDEHGNSPGVLAIAFSPSGQSLAYGGYGASVRVVDLTTKTETAQVEAAAAVWSLAFFGDDKLIVGAGSECGVLDLNRSRRTATWIREGIGESGNVRNVIVVPDGPTLVTAAQEQRTLKTWDLLALIGREETPLVERPVAIAPAEEIVVTTPPGQSVLHVGRPERGVALTSLAYESRENCLGVFSRDGDFFAAPLPQPDEGIAVWNTNRWRSPKELRSPGLPIRELALSRDGAWLAGAGRNLFVGVWKVETGDWRLLISPDENYDGWPSEMAIAFSPSENLLAVARRVDQHITLYHPEQGGAAQRIAAEPEIHSLAYTPDGSILAAGVRDVVLLFEVSTGRRLGVLRGEKRPFVRSILDIAVSPEGRQLASTATDDTLSLWDLATRRHLLRIPLPSRPHLLQFRASGQLVVACTNHRLLTFDLAPAGNPAQP